MGRLPFTFDGTRAEETTRPSYFVNLETLRTQGASYDTVLSSNTRQQARRSLRLFEDATGPLTLTQPRTLSEAMACLE